MLPLSVLQEGSGQFSQWSRRVTRRLPGEERIRLEDALDEVESRWIKTIDGYRFPVVTLSEKTEPDALCTIFETLNRTGVKLSVFELLTARFWPQEVNLRTLWDAATNQHPILTEFDVDPYYVLQAISLVSRSAPSCKRSDVLKLQASDIRRRNFSDCKILELAFSDMDTESAHGPVLDPPDSFSGHANQLTYVCE